MIVPDVQLLLYATIRQFPQHQAAKAWLEDLLSGTQRVAFPIAVVSAFIRLTTNLRGPLQTPLPLNEALAIVNDWLSMPNARLLHTDDEHWPYFEETLRKMGGGNMVSDAHLAALAIEHGPVLHSNDRDFQNVPGLLLVNPLQQADG